MADVPKKLFGSLNDAIRAKQEIAEKFNSYELKVIPRLQQQQHQVHFALIVVSDVVKSDGKHWDIYIDIVINIFGQKLNPLASSKLWSLYVEYLRHMQYTAQNKVDHNTMFQLTKTIAAYKNKVNTANSGKILLNMYRCQWILTMNRLKENEVSSLQEVRFLLKAFTDLYEEMYTSILKLKFVFVDVLLTSLQCFNNINFITVCVLNKQLPKADIIAVFKALFRMYCYQGINQPVNDSYIEFLKGIYMLMQFDYKSALTLQTSQVVKFLKFLRNHSLLKDPNPFSEFISSFQDYMAIINDRISKRDFAQIFYEKCSNVKIYLCNMSKCHLSDNWFGYTIFLLNHTYYHMTTNDFFDYIWKQLTEPSCYAIQLELIFEVMQLCKCAAKLDNQLFKMTCCNNTNNHVVLALAHSAMAIYEYYTQYINETIELAAESLHYNEEKNPTHKIFIKIMEMACDRIMEMDCITQSSRDLNVLIVRYKQITMKVQTLRQATTCVGVCELYMKMKKKIPITEWPHLLRRLYKTVAQNNAADVDLNRELQAIYICSLMECEYENNLNTHHLRDQINVFYTSNNTNGDDSKKCICEIYRNSQHVLKPYLAKTRQKLLFWFESQQILKYFKTNNYLIESLFNCYPSNYDLIMLYKNLEVSPKSLQEKVMHTIRILYESFNDRINSLSRLEHLIYGHAACALMQQKCDMNTRKQTIDGKLFHEDGLKHLPTQTDFQDISFKEEFYINKFGSESFMGFQQFFKKFDSEIISSDEALIDWQLILNDVAAVAQRFHLSGYLDRAYEVWLLHYDIAILVQDNYSALRSFTFLLENAEYLGQQKSLFSSKTIEEELKSHYGFLIICLEQLTKLPNRYQNYVLLCLLQLAYYYIRHYRYSYGQTLLQLVEWNHSNLNDRQDKYDIICITMDAIKIHLLWKHYDPYFDCANGEANNNCSNINKTSQEGCRASKLLMNRSLLKQIDKIIDRMSGFTAFSSMDYTLYKILLFQLAEMLGECLANRICDSSINSYFSAVCKVVVQSRLALRFVRLMYSWMWLNLQQENVDGAQIKLNLIGYLIDIQNIKMIANKTMETSAANPEIQKECKAIIPITARPQPPTVEPSRHVHEKQLPSTITHEVQVNCHSTKIDLKQFFKCPITKSDNELFNWTWFTIGCLTARLLYLVADYKELDEFYQQAYQWFGQRRNLLLKNYFQNIQLLSIQHYINYLRSQRQYENALKCLRNAMRYYFNDTRSSNIDVSYRVNFQLQLQTVLKELNDVESRKHIKVIEVPLNGRALQYSGIENSEVKDQIEGENFCNEHIQKGCRKNGTIAQYSQSSNMIDIGTIPKKTQHMDGKGKVKKISPNNAFIYPYVFNDETVTEMATPTAKATPAAIPKRLKKRDVRDELNEAFLMPTIRSTQTPNDYNIRTRSKRNKGPASSDITTQKELPLNTPRTTRRREAPLEQKRDYRPKI